MEFHSRQLGLLSWRLTALKMRQTFVPRVLPPRFPVPSEQITMFLGITVSSCQLPLTAKTRRPARPPPDLLSHTSPLGWGHFPISRATLGRLLVRRDARGRKAAPVKGAGPGPR